MEFGLKWKEERYRENRTVRSSKDEEIPCTSD
jgi:hypothetical protein